MMKINTKNFKIICGLNGLTPLGLCGRIGRHKTTVYKALREPQRFGPTVQAIEEALPVRELPHHAATN
jgi:hypothetical protein